MPAYGTHPGISEMIKRDYTIIRVVITIVTIVVMPVFVALMVNRHAWWGFALFASGAAINLYLKYRGNRAPLSRTSG